VTVEAAATRIPAFVRRHRVPLGLAGLVLALALVSALVAAFSGQSGTGPVPTASARTAPLPAGAPPVPEPMELKPVTPEDALAWNASIPVSDEPNPAARPFAFAASASEADRLRSLECLTAAVYYEAAIEPLDGQRAVAQVVLNRVRHPAYPNTVCGVVFEGAERRTGCQFTFTCDGSLARTPSQAVWERARRVAEAALGGYVHAPVGWATHYHTNWVVPYWAANLVKAANVGTHIFYRWTGGWGRPPAFASRHAGVEPAIAWRGGFRGSADIEMAEDARDQAAAAAAASAKAGEASVDSFQRAVLRRYEPLQRESATQIIAERQKAASPGGITASQRWALTGEGTAGSEPALGRRTERSDAPGAAPAPAQTPAPAPNNPLPIIREP
jgi:spore germination cell wall hydrolase CwlJ-like protein